MVEYINVPSSWNIRSNIPKEVLNICKKINVYLPCYLYGECLGDIIFLNKKQDFFQIICNLDVEVIKQLIPGSTIKKITTGEFQEESIVEVNIDNIKIVVTPLGVYKGEVLNTVKSIEDLLLSTPFYHNSFIYDVDKNNIGFLSLDACKLFTSDRSGFHYIAGVMQRRVLYLLPYDIFKYALAYKRMSELNSQDSNDRGFIKGLYGFYEIGVEEIISQIRSRNINETENAICFKDDINAFLEPHVYSIKDTTHLIDDEDISHSLNNSPITKFLEEYLSFLIPQFRVINKERDPKNNLLEVIARLLFNSYYLESEFDKYKYLDGKYGTAVILVSIFDAIAYNVYPFKENEVIIEIFNNSKIATLLPGETVALVNKILTFYKKINMRDSENLLSILNSTEAITPLSLILLTKEAKKEFGEYYMVALAPLFIRVGLNIFDKSVNRVMETINNSIERTKEDIRISELVDETLHKFSVDNNYCLSPNLFDFIAPILKNKIKNNTISGDVDSIINAIKEILTLL